MTSQGPIYFNIWTFWWHLDKDTMTLINFQNCLVIHWYSVLQTFPDTPWLAAAECYLLIIIMLWANSNVFYGWEGIATRHDSNRYSSMMETCECVLAVNDIWGQSSSLVVKLLAYHTEVRWLSLVIGHAWLCEWRSAQSKTLLTQGCTSAAVSHVLFHNNHQVQCTSQVSTGCAVSFLPFSEEFEISRFHYVSVTNYKH